MSRLAKLAGFAVALCGAAGSAVAMSYYNAGVSAGEYATFTLELPAHDGIAPVEIDLGTERLPKALFSPDIVTFQAGSITNKSTEPLTVRFALADSDLHAGLTIDGVDGDFNRVVPLPPGGQTSISVVVTLPPSARNRPVPLETMLSVEDIATGTEVASVPLRVRR